MQKSYKGLDELITFVSKFYSDKDSFQIGSGENTPDNYVQTKSVFQIGYEPEVTTKLMNSNVFTKIFVIVDKSYNFQGFSNKVVFVPSREVKRYFKNKWESIDLIYITKSIEKQLDMVKEYYPFTKCIIAGNNFDKKVTNRIFRHSDSVKFRFEDNNWLFMAEQRAWLWEDSIKDKEYMIREVSNGKIFLTYEDDNRLLFKYQSKNRGFKKYTQNSKYTDFTKFSPSARKLLMTKKRPTPIQNV